MENLTQKYIDRLLQISTKKHNLLHDIYELTIVQAETINEDGIEALERIVGDKQIKIDEINKVDEEFGVYYQRLKHELKIDSLEDLETTGIEGVKELKDVIKQVMDLIKQISVIENENNRKAKKLLNSFSEEITKINQHKLIANAYRTNPTVIAPSYYVDKKK